MRVSTAALNHRTLKRPRILIPLWSPKPIVCYVYYAFVFSLMFEVTDLGLPYTPTKLLGFLLVLVMFFKERKLLFRPPPKAFWCFAIYLTVYVLLSIFEVYRDSQNAVFTDAIIEQLFTMTQMLIFFCISYNLLRADRVKESTLVVLAVSCIILASLQIVGITSTSLEVYGDRVSTLGGNPNTLASVLTLGLLVLTGLAYGRKKMDRKVRLLFWVSSVVLSISVVQTGSRGNVLALMLSLLILVVKPHSASQNLKAGLLVSLMIGFLALVSYQIEFVRERWESTYYGEDVSGRDDIYATAWEMFLEKPIIGWGPVNHYYELGYRLLVPTRDPHNLYLWLLLEGGLLGAIPFLGGLWICAISAWKARRSSQGVLPMALLAYYLLVNLKGTYMDKYFWLVLAYTLASSNENSISWRRSDVVLRGGVERGRQLARHRAFSKLRFPKNVFQHTALMKGKLA
jgi:O-antigen ligase